MRGRWSMGWILLATLLGVLAESAGPATALELDELYQGEAHDDPTLPRVHWLGRGDEYLLEREDDDGRRRWYRIDTASGEERAWLDPNELRPDGAEEPLEVDRVEFSPDGSIALLATEREKRWRRSRPARHWILRLDSGELSELDRERVPQIHPRFSPDGRRLAYVHDGDLYLRSLDGSPARALTHDGGAEIRNGDPDWVYEEELGYSEAFWWSPDSARIAFLRSDTGRVGDYPLLHLGDAPLPRVEALPYPKAGAANSEVELELLELADGHMRALRSFGQQGYAGRVEWLDDGRLLLQELDRAQSTVRLLVFSEGSVEATLLLEEHSEAWIEPRSDIHFLEGGRFLRVGSRDGFAHVYLHDATGRVERQITRGRWEVLELLAVDEEAGRIAVQTDRGDRAQRHLDAVALLDGRVRRLSGSGGWHDAEFDPSGRRYVETWSELERRPTVLLREADGGLLRALHEPTMEDLEGEELGDVRFVVIPGADGDELPARLTLPEDFEPGRRYPVLLHCYGGPGSQLVRDRWGGKSELFHRLLVQQGIVVVSVDNRGTRGRGDEFLHSVYRRLGQLEAADQVAAANWLVEQGYADPDRIGIWGWSYGGYLSAMSLLEGAGVIRCAASVAPVSDWSLYDTIYTERYMGLPQENTEGYTRGSLLEHAAELRGALFVLHGGSDDNVHVQNTLRLAAALQEQDRPFEMMIYPDQNHSIEGEHRRLHLRRALLSFFRRELLGRPDAAAQEAGSGLSGDGEATP